MVHVTIHSCPPCQVIFSAGTWAVTTGVISGLREIDGVRYIQISAPISPGNSGGPVILRDGSVIGIATMRLKDGQNLNFAIAAADIVASGLFDPARMKSRSTQ